MFERRFKRNCDVSHFHEAIVVLWRVESNDEYSIKYAPAYMQVSAPDTIFKQ